MTPYVILDDPTLVTEPVPHDDDIERESDTDEDYVDLLRAVFMPEGEEPHPSGSPIDVGYTDFLRAVYDGHDDDDDDDDDDDKPVEERPPSPTIEELWSMVIDGGIADGYDVAAAAANASIARLGIDDLLDGKANDDDDDDDDDDGGIIKKRAESDDGIAFAAFLDNINGVGEMESAVVVVDGRGGGVPVPDQRDADFDAFLSYFNSQEVQQERRRGTMITTRIDNFDFLPDQHGDTVEALWSRIVSGMSDAPPEPPSWFWSWFGQTSTAAQGGEMRRKMESKGGYGDAYPAAAVVNGQVEPPSWFGSWFGYSSAAQVQPVEAHRGVDTAEHEDSFV